MFKPRSLANATFWPWPSPMASCTHCLHLLYKPSLIHLELFLFNQQTTSKTNKYGIVGDFHLLINKNIEFLNSSNQPCIMTTLILKAIVPFFLVSQCLTFCNWSMRIVKLFLDISIPSLQSLCFASNHYALPSTISWSLNIIPNSFSS
jgi:hypothetical protein